MKHTRLIALILCVALLVTMLSGCGKKTLMKIDGEAVFEGMYTYYYSQLYATYLSYGYTEEQIREYALAQVKQIVAVKKLGEELKIEFEPLENKAIIDARNEQIEEVGRASFVAMLKAMGLTERQYAEMDKLQYVYAKLYEYYYGDEGIEKPTTEQMASEYATEYIRASHILLSTQEAESDEDRAAVKAKAEEVLAKAKAGEDFAALIKEYGEDPGMEDNEETGYYFTTGEMVAQFESAAFALEVDGISELVETAYGYHIIKRLPITDEYVAETVGTDEYYQTYCSGLLNEKVMAKMDTLTVEYTEDFDKMDYTTAISYWLGY